MQAEDRISAGARGFGDDFARPIEIEAIDHHAVEAGEGAHLARGDAIERALIAYLPQPGDHAAHDRGGVERRLIYEGSHSITTLSPVNAMNGNVEGGPGWSTRRQRRAPRHRP